MGDLLTAFGLVFLAELGDKSMLLAVAFATRYRPVPVLGGIATAALVMLGAATLLGALLGASLPHGPLALVGGLLFLGFGVWTLRDDGDEETATLRGSSVLLGVTVAFLVAEFGDKTMLATVALAGTGDGVTTWLGASAGMTLASGLAIVLASVVGSRLPERVVQLVSAGAFLVFGVLLIVEGVRAMV